MTDSALTVAQPWYARAAEAFAAALRGPATTVRGATSALEVYQEFPTRRSMATLGGDAWVRACVKVKSGDLAGLPLYAWRQNGAQREILPGHPALTLLNRPSPRESGRRFRAQQAADYSVCGNAFSAMPAPGLLVRLHPASVVPIVGRYGLLESWIWRPPNSVDPEQFNADQVYHVGDLSWSDGADQILGESPIRALASDLDASKSAKQMAALQARRGRPDIMLSPAENQAVGKDAAERTAEIYERAMRTGQGVFALNSAWKAQVLGMSPRDMEYQAMTSGARDAVGVTFGVPGTRLNLLSGGYGQARQEARSYWENLVGDLGRAFEDVWSRLTFDENVGISHDISGVEALQVANLDRMDQAIRLVSLGATPAEALTYVGLEDAPSGEPSAAIYSPAARRPDEPQDPRPRGSAADSIASYLQGAAARYEASQGSRGDLEAGRLAALLEQDGLPPTEADALAREVVADTDAAIVLQVARARVAGEALAGFANLSAFSVQRAERIAAFAATLSEAA